MTSNREKYEPIAREAAQRYGIDPELFVRQINQESGFNPAAKSGAGAQGIAQIMPATAKGWKVDPNQPIAALNAAARNMAQYQQTYIKQGKDPNTAAALALAAYNAGAGAVAKYDGIPPYKETQNYVKSIMGNARVKSSYEIPAIAPINIPSTPEPKINVPMESLSDLSARLNKGGPWEQPAFTQAKQKLGNYNPTTAIPDIPSAQLQETVTPIPDAQMALPDDMRQLFDNAAARAAAPKPEAPPPPTDIGKEFFSGISNPLTAYTRDAEAKQYGGKPAFETGQFIGSIGASIGGALAGAGVGALAGTAVGGPVGTVIGGVGGLVGEIGTGGILGGSAEAQRQRLAGEKTDFGKIAGSSVIEGALNAIPIVGGAKRLLPRAAINAGVQGAGAVAGSAVQQGIEQQTFTPNLDLGRLAVSGGIGAAGGIAGGALGRNPKMENKPKPIRIAPQQGQAVSALPPRVVPTTPSVQTTVLAEAAPTFNAESFNVPSQPVVKPVEYAPIVTDTTKPTLSGVDAALYDLAVDPNNQAALSAAREALPDYGDQNLLSQAKQVQQIVDTSIAENGNAPKGITEKLIKPKVDPTDAVMDVTPKPLSPESIADQGRQLRGNRDQMIEQGTRGSIVKDIDTYKALLQRKKDLPTKTENKLRDASDLTDDMLKERGNQLIAAIDAGNYLPLKSEHDYLINKMTKLANGDMRPAEINTFRQRLIDSELRYEKNNITGQINQLNENVKAAFASDYNKETGFANQKALTGAKTYEDVKDLLTGPQNDMAKILTDVMDKDGRVYIDADTNITGATSRVGERLVTPLGFNVDKDGSVKVVAYNEEGYFSSYYITPKMSKNGEDSVIHSIGNVVNQSGYRGEYANLYKGIRQFSVDDILKRPPRNQGITTVESLATLKKVAELADNEELKLMSPSLNKLLQEVKDNPRATSVKSVEKLKELLTIDPKLLKKLCGILGKV